MTAQQIINDVAGYYGITPGQLIHGDKHRKYSEPRHVAAYMMRTDLKMVFRAIGELLGDKKYSTIMYSVRKVNDWVNMPRLNPDAVKCINQLKSY